MSADDATPRVSLPAGEIDLLRRVLVREGETVPLTGLEVDLVRYLAGRPGVAVSRRELLDRVWGYGRGVRSRAVDNTVRRLRGKIEVDPTTPMILCTVHGHGYRWDPPAANPGDRTVTMTRPVTGGANEPGLVLRLVHHEDPVWVDAVHRIGPGTLALGRDSTSFGVGALADGRISRRHAELVYEGTELRLRDLQSRNGTLVNGQRVVEVVLTPGDVVEMGTVLLLVHLEPPHHEPPRHPVLIGRSAAWAEVIRQIARLSVTDDPVAVVGEPGTGRTLVARTLREASGSDRAPVWTASPGEARPAGCAVLTLPPLRARPSDILVLARHFAPADLSIGAELALRLLRDPWPGNVAQLREIVEGQ